MSALLPFRRPLPFVGALLAVILALPTTLPAAPVAPPARELSSPVSDQLSALRDFTDAKNYTAALALLAPLIAVAPSDSYDLAVLSQIKAQIILNQGDATDQAVAPLETALRLGDAHGYLDPRQTLDVLYLLAQLHYQRATENHDAALQLAEFSAAAAIRRWLDQVARPGEDAVLLAALIYYNEATVGNHPPEPAALRRVLDVAAQGLTLSLQPKETLYLLVLDAEQQLGDTAAAADTLELLVQRSPANHDYWQQLAAIYLAQASAAKATRENDRLNLRALLTFERAQVHGALTTPADNFNVAGLYYNLHQFDRALSLLESGLQTGAITDEPGHWELLANAGQSAHEETRALSTLADVAARHPDDGRVNYATARLEYAMDQHPAARKHLELALARGHLDHPGQAAFLLAFLDMEARQFDAAARWLDEAARHDDTPPADIARLRESLAAAHPTPP